MPLFNPKTLARRLPPVEPPPAHATILANWAALVTSGRVREQTEVQLHPDFKSKIMEGVLGYRSAVDHVAHTITAEQKILSGRVDLALGHFGDGPPRVIAPLELKGADTADLDAIMPGRNKTPVQQAWAYATAVPGAQWVMVCNYIEFRLYRFGNGTAQYERFELARLTDPAEYARFYGLLNADSLLGGETLALLEASDQEDRDITAELYDDISELRIALLQAIDAAGPQLPWGTVLATAQKVLDRVLFIAFAEDIGLLPDNILERAYDARNPFAPEPVWRNFQGLFTAIDQGLPAQKIARYNGGLFAPDPVLDQLQLPDEVCEHFKKLGTYDFESEVPVTVLGHIFEQSITDIEALSRGDLADAVAARDRTRKQGTRGRRKRDGIVYTPDRVARFIVDATLGHHLRTVFRTLAVDYTRKGSLERPYEDWTWRRKKAELELWTAYRKRIATLRVLDPACGSGVFLVAALDFLVVELERVARKIADLSGNPQTDLFDPVRDVLAHNLYGVDVNAASVELARLSLWVRTARPGKELSSLEHTLRVGDSLVEDPAYAYLGRAFDWQAAFPEVFEDGGFDVVLGNPPYVRMEFLKAVKPYLETHYTVASDRADLYCYFFERSVQVMRPGGRMGFIASSTFFKTGSGAPLRRFLARETTLERIVDFGELQLFEGVTTYPTILTLEKRAPDEDHAAQCWNVEAIPTSDLEAAFRAAAFGYPQQQLGDGSWELEPQNLSSLREKLREGRRTLGEVFGAPLRGVVTGLNAAFVVDRATRDAIVANDPGSAELLRPFLEGKDTKRWRVESRDLFLLYIPKNRLQIGDYPGAKAWLEPFKEKLERRATKQEWFELQQAQEAFADRYAGPKIIYGHFQAAPIFSFDPDGYFSNDKTYALPVADYALLALLNSRVTWFVFSSLSSAKRGGYFEARNLYIEQLPIPDWTEAQREQLAALAEDCQRLARARYDEQAAFRRRIPDLCPPTREPKLSRKLQAWWEMPDFSAFQAEVRARFRADIPLRDRNDWQDWFESSKRAIAGLTASIAAKEDEVHEVVCALFDLDAEERALLESQVPF